jgi:hypothetical protein
MGMSWDKAPSSRLATNTTFTLSSSSQATATFGTQTYQLRTHAADVLLGHSLQKRTEVQWDIGAALGADDGADESTSPQVGIR